MKPLLRSALLAGATLSTALALTALVEPQSPQPASRRLDSTVLDLAKLTAQITASGERRELFDAPTLALDRFRCHVTTLKPGAGPHKGHRHAHEEMLVIKEGTLEVTIEGKTQTAAAGAVVFLALGVEHSLLNPGTEPTRYDVFRWYTPAGGSGAGEPTGAPAAGDKP
jgi:XRE family transcriptional regulator, regulator of sulfur utilization